MHSYAVCKAGHQPSPDDDGSCEVCKEGTFKAQKGNKKCEECTWPKTTEHRGALTPDACGETPGLVQIMRGCIRQSLCLAVPVQYGAVPHPAVRAVLYCIKVSQTQNSPWNLLRQPYCRQHALPTVIQL